MQIGRFFSLQQGRVGQYLSPRVLVVRSPFRAAPPTGEPKDFCCFGFDGLRQAQKFLQSLAHLGLRCQIQQRQWLSHCAYEVVLPGQTDLARTLAEWDRRDLRLDRQAGRRRTQPSSGMPESGEAIAA
jgi:hypothetical protein